MNTASSSALLTGMMPTKFDGTTEMLRMTTKSATSAEIGDHVELRLVNTGNSNALSKIG